MSYCPICHEKVSEPFFQSRLGWGVRSDWTPIPDSTVLYLCEQCQHVFKDETLVNKWAHYQNGYSAWQNTTTLDKLEFRDGFSATRSAIMLSYLKKIGVFNQQTKILDYGCNRGSFLNLLPRAGHAGFDVSEHYAPIIAALGFEYFSPENPPPAGQFDLMTLLHVFEHLNSFSRDLELGLSALKTDGVAMFQVPNSCAQPSDYYVMDHRSHFGPNSFDLALRGIGLRPVTSLQCIVSGELTGVYSKVGSDSEIMKQPYPYPRPSIVKEVLEVGEKSLLALKKENRPCFIYGAGLLGSLASMVLDRQVAGFIDDNPGLQGATMNGIKIYPYDEIKPGSMTILIAVPPPVSQKVANKCLMHNHRIHTTYSPVPDLGFPIIPEDINANSPRI